MSSCLPMSRWLGPVKALMKKLTASGAFCARSRDHPAWFSRSALMA